MAIRSGKVVESDPAGDAERGGEVAVRQTAGDAEGTLAGGNADAPFEHAA
jgi:hypothetical protein